jgi:hypothetical protein
VKDVTTHNFLGMLMFAKIGISKILVEVECSFKFIRLSSLSLLQFLDLFCAKI